MSNQLSIKIDFHQNRSNPQAIFEAMALYIKFHTDIGQILFNSINEQINFNFELDDIERSSLLSKISPKGLLNWAENFYSKFSEETFREIADLDDEISPSDIDNLSSKIEDKIQADLNPPFAVEINRSALSSALKTLTAANSKLLDDEPVTFSRNTSNVIHINTRQRIVKEEEKTKEKAEKEILILTVISPKNEGHAAWHFKCEALNQKFNASITDKDWLSRYQNQIIPPIGPKDKIEALVSYNIDLIERKLINVRVLEIKDIIRKQKQLDLQYEP